MKSLDEIGLIYQTDKASNGNNYLQYYDMFFSTLRKDKISLLEIGIWEGASLKMWKEYFKNGTITGIDIDEKGQYKEDRINICKGDQFSEIDLVKVNALYGVFDIIIDDGSHIGEHQLFSFETLFKGLNGGGYYVIEDCLCAYDERWNKEVNIFDRVKKMIGEVNMNGKIQNSHICANKQIAYKKYEATYFEQNIEWVFSSCGLVIIKKMNS